MVMARASLAFLDAVLATSQAEVLGLEASRRLQDSMQQASGVPGVQSAPSNSWRRLHTMICCF